MYLPIACPAGTHIPKTEQKKSFRHQWSCTLWSRDDARRKMWIWDRLGILPVSFTELFLWPKQHCGTISECAILERLWIIQQMTLRKRKKLPNPNQEHSRAATYQVQETTENKTPADHTSKGVFIYYQVHPSYSCNFWSIKKPFPSLVQCWDWRINVLMSDINLARRSNIIFPANHCMGNNGSSSVCRLAHLCTMSTLSCSFQVNQHRGEMSNPWAALASIRAGMEQPRSLQPPRWTFLISQSKQVTATQLSLCISPEVIQIVFGWTQRVYAASGISRGVAAIKARLLLSPAGLLVCSECSQHRSCPVLSQAILSNKIQKARPSMSPSSLSDFPDNFLWNCFILEKPYFKFSNSNLKSHFQIYHWGVVQNSFHSWNPTWSLLWAPPTHGDSMAKGIRWNTLGTGETHLGQAKHTWDRRHTHGTGATHRGQLSKQIFGKSTQETSARTVEGGIWVLQWGR